MRDVIIVIEIVSTPLIIGAVMYVIARSMIADHLRMRRANERRDPKVVACRSCGYDLRASRDRCPECGTKIPTSRDRAIARGLQLDPDALQNDWPGEPVDPRTPAPDEKCTIVHFSRQWAEADLLVQQLRARGILAELKQCEGLALPSIGSCNWAVAAPLSDEEMARKVVDGFRLKPSGTEGTERGTTGPR